MTVDLLRAVRRTFTGPARLAGDATNAQRLEVYLTDMLRPYGLHPDPGALHRAAGQSYGEMAEWAIGALLGPADDVDLLVLAFAVPDVTPGRATATYLSHVCPGTPLAFAICDQGRAAAFTGLRIVREYGCRRALLVVVEQADLPYPVRPPVPLPAVHSVVALLLGSGPSAHPVTSIDIHTDTSIDEARARLPRGGTVILGSSLGGADTARPYTGVWWELAGALEEAPGRVVLADYDEQLRYLCTATVERHCVTATS